MRHDALVLTAAVLAAGVIVAGPVFSTDSAALPAEEVQGNISFVSGGVGEDEAAALKRAAARFPLQLQFVQKAWPRDEFLADVKVRIRDRSKTVLLDTVSQGPFLLAKLPAGTYQLEAEHEGVVKRQTVVIRAGKHERAVFVWAPSEETRSMRNDPLARNNIEQFKLPTPRTRWTQRSAAARLQFISSAHLGVLSAHCVKRYCLR